MKYQAFCSPRCNREYHVHVVAPDTTNNTEPFCLNCGRGTEPLSDWLQPKCNHPATEMVCLACGEGTDSKGIPK